MKKLGRFGLAIVMLLSLAAVGTGATFAAGADFTCSDASPDCDFLKAQEGSDFQTAAYWATYLHDNYGGDWTCEKVDSTATPVVLAADHGALIIKAGDAYYGWLNVTAGTEYSAPQATSHYYVCDETTVEDEFIPPTGHIEGPCADPAYYAIMDNSAGNTLVKFRFRWYNNNGLNTSVKWVPAGDIFTTWQHWAKPGTYVSLSYKDPNTNMWVLLDKELVVKGRYPACQYTPGWTHSTQG